MTGPAKQKVTLPEVLPILPLQEVVLLPHARLPLNIFEPRYITMIEDTLGKDRMIGLVQPSKEADAHKPQDLYSVGCAGKIISFVETEDHRFLITLQGVCRFEVKEEVPSKTGYRMIKPEWKNYIGDLSTAQNNAEIDHDQLTSLLRTYFKQLGVNADWEVILKTSNDDLISSLIMICPLAANEKQALLEANTQVDRTKLLISLLEMACLNKGKTNNPRH